MMLTPSAIAASMALNNFSLIHYRKIERVSTIVLKELLDDRKEFATRYLLKVNATIFLLYINQKKKKNVSYPFNTYGI